jgi:hypothetical protein
MTQDAASEDAPPLTAPISTTIRNHDGSADVQRAPYENRASENGSLAVPHWHRMVRRAIPLIVDLTHARSLCFRPWIIPILLPGGEHQPPSKKPQALARCGSPGFKN